MLLLTSISFLVVRIKFANKKKIFFALSKAYIKKGALTEKCYHA